MTIEELKGLAAFVRLAPKQQSFVTALCTNGRDKTKAALTAYACKDEASAVTIANRLLAKTDIKRMVSSYYDEDPGEDQFTKDEFLGFLTKKLKADTTPANIMGKLADLYAEVQGWKIKAANNDDSEPPETASKSGQALIDDLVHEMEHRVKKEKLT